MRMQLLWIVLHSVWPVSTRSDLTVAAGLCIRKAHGGHAEQAVQRAVWVQFHLRYPDQHLWPS